MKDIALVVAGRAFTWGDLVLFGGGLCLVMLLVTVWQLMRARRERIFEAALASERAQEMDDRVADLTRLQAEISGRLQTVAEVFGSRQGEFARLVAERLEGLQHRMGQGLEASARHQAENLSKLHERLAVIDAAQKNLKDLTGEVLNLRDVLANKQSRGAYGQGRMEAIIRDGLPAGCFQFQATLSNRTRPDCLVHLPGDARPLVIDAKFPLEGFIQFRNARDDEARARAASRVRGDLAVHVRDISEKYLLPGETQDLALMFVPAESIYADLAEFFEDIVQKAHRARVVIVSPSLLSLAIQVLQALVRDARVREEARIIQTEVQKLVRDVGRLGERVARLDGHFRQAQEDVAQIRTSTEKITKHGARIEALEFAEADAEMPSLRAVHTA
ncbi:DNA recombination protein RmuC [Microvirga massiliensis]|uniref:DNA recombination protein RmuC n=1 Tax=Microvirga massiliensis TaxID=1033741 RepID=UPI00062B2FFF|nr:DNA recombination protein RmuC [Microvirga massiliensis]